MAVLLLADIIAEVRSRVGDDTTGNYLMSDSAMEREVAAAYRKLFKYAQNEQEDTIAGSGVREYPLPVNVDSKLIVRVAVRPVGDPDQEMVVNYVDIYAGKIRMPMSVDANSEIVIRHRAPFTINSDISSTAAEMLYVLLEIAWIEYAAKRRADFEQWAATNRADARIPEILQLRREKKRDLEEMAQDFTNRLQITDVWGGS